MSRFDALADNGKVAASLSLPPPRQVTNHIMQTWALHEQMLKNLPTDHIRDVHMLHHIQSVYMLDETSVLHGNMPQHNDEEGSKQLRLSFSPAVSVWGQIVSAWTTTEAITENDYVTFFINSSGSPTTLPSLLLQTCHAPVICNDDDVFYLFFQKQKIGAKLHVYLEEGTFHDDPSFIVLTETKFSFRCIKRLFRGPNTNDMKK